MRRALCMADLRKIMNKCSERYRWIWDTLYLLDIVDNVCFQLHF
jgi:hypothetical protein